jgi:protein-tyrosine-phosphatase
VNVIFVCTGNTCRSPLAEGIARKIAAERGIEGLTFSSAGIGAFDGAPASDAAILIGLERGIDLSRHRARSLTPSVAEGETILLAMATSHLAAIRAIAPHARAYLLSDYASRGANQHSVSDPFGGDLAAYRQAADDIESLISEALNRLVAEPSSGPR